LRHQGGGESLAEGIDVYLGLGSNLGSRENNLCRAMIALRRVVSVLRVSSVYESTPVGPRDQPDYLNLVLRGRTHLAAEALLARCKHIEARVGRTPTHHWGPRVIDIDVLLFGDQSMSLPHLTIPHPQMLNRLFVVIPLCEIAPTLALPEGNVICPPSSLAGQTIRSLGSLESLSAHST
jgi:2-amino-4-hydroxy-6-hydroxymethyldihydropteridine diphosphokinase